jgi:isopenicillin-N N-acyltransferase like protein
MSRLANSAAAPPTGTHGRFRPGSVSPRATAALLVVLCGVSAAWSQEAKALFFQAGMRLPAEVVSSPASGTVAGGGYRAELSNGVARVPLVVVGGKPYEMGWHIGQLLRPEIRRFVPAAAAAFMKRLGVTAEELSDVWKSTAPFTDDRFEQELLGLSDGSGVPLATLQQVHCLPLLLPYSCSSVAAWGKATRDGHLYHTRDLDWDLEVGAHEFPVVLVFVPERGTAHAVPSFAGFIGAHCGMNAAGISLAEMGDSPSKEAPYNVRAPHFTTWFRRVLRDADSLTDALAVFREQPMTKRYHFVFGDGRKEHRAVKIRAHSPEAPADRVRIWTGNDPDDELAPKVLPDVVYQDEGRGAYPVLREHHGKIDARTMVDLCNRLPIKGSNVMNAVFDATGQRIWVSYAHGDMEAYKRPYVLVELNRLDGDRDGIPDLKEGAGDRDGDGRPDFLDP